MFNKQLSSLRQPASIGGPAAAQTNKGSVVGGAAGRSLSDTHFPFLTVGHPERLAGTITTDSITFMSRFHRFYQGGGVMISDSFISE